MTTIVKVGGSLYDMPDLSVRLRKFLARLDGQVRLFPGGGPAADVIQSYDARHSLGEESCHWLALRMLSVNAYFLASLLPGIGVVNGHSAALHAVLDPYEVAKADEANPGRLPHSWNVTSD